MLVRVFSCVRPPACCLSSFIAIERPSASAIEFIAMLCTLVLFCFDRGMENGTPSTTMIKFVLGFLRMHASFCDSFLALGSIQ